MFGGNDLEAAFRQQYPHFFNSDGSTKYFHPDGKPVTREEAELVGPILPADVPRPVTQNDVQSLFRRQYPHFFNNDGSIKVTAPGALDAVSVNELDLVRSGQYPTQYAGVPGTAMQPQQQQQQYTPQQQMQYQQQQYAQQQYQPQQYPQQQQQMYPQQPMYPQQQIAPFDVPQQMPQPVHPYANPQQQASHPFINPHQQQQQFQRPVQQPTPIPQITKLHTSRVDSVQQATHVADVQTSPIHVPQRPIVQQATHVADVQTSPIHVPQRPAKAVAAVQANVDEDLAIEEKRVEHVPHHVTFADTQQPLRTAPPPPAPLRPVKTVAAVQTITSPEQPTASRNQPFDVSKALREQFGA